MIEITLGADPATGEGGVTVPVYPQRHAYLANRLGRYISELVETAQQLSVETIIQEGGAQAYRLLVLLVPSLDKRMTEWEFCGYPTREAMAAGDYDPGLDTTAPTIPEIREAISTAAQTNGLDLLTHLKGVFGLVDPTLLRSMVNGALLDVMDQGSTTSRSSPSANGDSRSTSSGTTPPASTPSEASPSLASAG